MSCGSSVRHFVRAIIFSWGNSLDDINGMLCVVATFVHNGKALSMEDIVAERYLDNIDRFSLIQGCF